MERAVGSSMGSRFEPSPRFREPGPRLEMMDESGVDRTILYPTLASLLEERLKDDPFLTHVAIHAVNEWIYETWTFNFSDRIFATRSSRCPSSSERSRNWNGYSNGALARC